MFHTALRAVALIATLSVATAPSPAQPLQQAPPHITVVGRAQETIEPDALRISIGVETRGTSHLEAMAENARLASKVIEAAKTRGVKPADIRTGRIDLHHTPDRAQPTTPYRAANMVIVTARQLAEVDRLIADLITAGANRVHGVVPIVEPDAARSARLREKAIANAREIAEQSVRAAGARLGAIISIDAANSDPVGPFNGPARATLASVPIEEGTVPVSVSVTMTWTIAQ